MTERQPGWYHVKNTRSGWECAQWNGYSWHGVFLNDAPDDVWTEIGPRIPTPDEDWLCVPIKPTYRMTNAAAFTSHDNIETGGGGQEYRRRIAEHEYFAMLSAAPKPGGG